MNILITGGGSGLGEAITRELALDEECRIFFTYCRSEANAHLLEKSFPNTTAIRVDFTKKEDIAALIQQMETMKLDALINNAITGIELKRFHEVDPEFYLERFQKNVTPVIAITSQAINIFRKRGKGKIITILTSYLSQHPPLGLSAYVAEKAYLASLNKSWATENSRFHITANTISPSFMSTGLTKEFDQRLIAGEAKNALDPNVVAQKVGELLHSADEVSGTDFMIKSS